jgi:hypothetical protein
MEENRAPRQHNTEVYGALGLSEAELATLRGRKVI